MVFMQQSSHIHNLDDVAINNLANNQTLAYDATLAKWKNTSASSGTVTSASITDSTATGRSLITAANSAAVRTAAALTNVDNTADAAKPVSTATQTALNAKADTTSAQIIVRYNSTTSTWPARPAGALWGVLFLSTNSASAVAPSDANLAAGDRWLRHPNAS